MTSGRRRGVLERTLGRSTSEEEENFCNTGKPRIAGDFGTVEREFSLHVHRKDTSQGSKRTTAGDKATERVSTKALPTHHASRDHRELTISSGGIRRNIQISHAQDRDRDDFVCALESLSDMSATEHHAKATLD